MKLTPLRRDDRYLRQTYDLPPRWEGHPIDWDTDWRTTACVLMAPNVEARIRVPCERCRCCTAPIYTCTHAPAPLRLLVLFRCPTCHLDRVLDWHAGTWRTLTEDDYTASGVTV